MNIFAKKILTPDGFVENKVVTVKNGVITDIGDDRNYEISVGVLSPGLFDIHNHGGEGYDTTSLDIQLLEKFLIRLIESGVTDILITLLTSQVETLVSELDFIKNAMQLQSEGKLMGANIVGVHMEGPFLSPDKAGAQKLSEIIPPSVDLFRDNFECYSDIIKLITVAPEIDGAIEFAKYLRSINICVQAGHTCCDSDRAILAFSNGFDSVCHTFNACPPIHHREPGIVTEALLDKNIYTEVICDMTHLHPSIVKLLYNCKGSDKMVVISDSTMPMGLPDGVYFYADDWVKVENGERRTLTGALNGGLCYLDKSVSNLINIGIDAADALMMASTTPAKRLGIQEIGEISLGKLAHLTMFDNDMHVVGAVLGDKVIFAK